MDKFNISQYITIVRKGLTSASAQGPAGILLLDTFSSILKKEIYFTDDKITRLVKHYNNVDNEIIKSVANEKNIQKFIKEFKKIVEPDFNLSTINNACLKLINLINSEPNLAKSYKDILNEAYENSDKATFLALALVYAVGMENTYNEKELLTDDVPYLTEAQNHCPLCNKQLYKIYNGKKYLRYQIARVYEEEFSKEFDIDFNKYQKPKNLDAYENKIVLCPDCYDKYLNEPSIELFDNLYNKKNFYLKFRKIENLLFDIDIENEIFLIVNKLGELTPNDSIDLIPLEPHTIIEKIPNDKILRDTVTNWVLTYYKFIEKQFSDLSSIGKGTFNIIAHQIATAYEKLENLSTLTQTEIFNHLSKWIAEKINYPLDKIIIINIIVAFFVQNCEVFHALS